MPIFKTTEDILKTPWKDDLFDENWMDSDSLILPPSYEWDYSRELQIEDIEIWEQIYYQGGGLGLYAAWLPYAEFYMITNHLFLLRPDPIETFYGKLAGKRAYERAIELGMPIPLNKIFVENEDMWLYTN